MDVRTPDRLVLGAVLLALLASTTAHSQPLAFEGAEGFGALSKGGAGGQVIEVTTLANQGPGSLRAALAAEGPRIVKFKVAGTIATPDPLSIQHPYVTVAGESAPEPGITILGRGIDIRDPAHDVVIRNLRIRVTHGGSSGDGVLVWGRDGNTVYNVIVDHCSISWATDENVNTWGRVRDVTFQWCIIAEGRAESGDHDKGAHSCGWLGGAGSERITIHHCLFAHNADRSPRIAGGIHDVVNNVVYNWLNNNASKVGGGAQANFVGNLYLDGPESAGHKGVILVEALDKGTKVYAAGNIGGPRDSQKVDEWALATWYEPRAGGGWVHHQPAPDAFRSLEPFAAVAVGLTPMDQLLEEVLRKAGAQPRDPTDRRVIGEVRTRTGRIGAGTP